MEVYGTGDASDVRKRDHLRGRGRRGGLGRSATALGHGIHTLGEFSDEIRRNVGEAVDRYFDEEMPRPRLIRPHLVRDEQQAAWLARHVCWCTRFRSEHPRSEGREPVPAEDRTTSATRSSPRMGHGRNWDAVRAPQRDLTIVRGAGASNSDTRSDVKSLRATAEIRRGVIRDGIRCLLERDGDSCPLCHSANQGWELVEHATRIIEMASDPG